MNSTETVIDEQPPVIDGSTEETIGDSTGI